METKAHAIAKLVWKMAGLDEEETIDGIDRIGFERKVEAILDR